MLLNRHRVAGQSHPRLDSVSKAIGRQVYGVDVSLPGMLFGRVFRSTVPHARIVKIDVSRARAIRGVHTILTGADIPAAHYGVAIKDMTVLAGDRVRYIGQPVALIAATSLEIADAALSAIIVEYEALPAVFDPEAALMDGAPLLHPDVTSYAKLPVYAPRGNVANRAVMRFGDLNKAFAIADRVYEHRFTTAMVHAGYTEPRAAVANWDTARTVMVYSNAQTPYEVQATLSDVLQIPASDIRVIVPGIGGGFGGKLRIGVEHFAALLARKAARPVKIVTTSEEELIAAHPRQATVITLKTAVTKDGKLLGRQARVVLDCGAHAGSGPGTAAVALNLLIGPYRTPAFGLEGLAVYTNKVPSGSFRAPSGPMANFAVESQMDMIADDLGIDPLELRLRNIVREGDIGPSGEVLKSVSIDECLRKAAAAIGWSDRATTPGRGKGIACGWWVVASAGSSGVFVKIGVDGRVFLNSGAVELGTGALTGAAQILAEELGVEPGDIKIAPVDTNSAPYDFGAQGSRTMFSVGNACRAAAADLRAQLFAAASRALDVPATKLELRDKCVVAGDKRVAIADLARASNATGGGFVASGTAIPKPPPYDAARFEHHPMPVWIAPSFYAHAADLRVDPGTGEVTIDRYVVAQDVGYAINPAGIEGQIEGGVVQGLGQALSEEIVVEGGRVRNANLTDYKMPTSLDVPDVETILVECPCELGPYGAKGVGEPPIVTPPATVANAIAAATGQWITSLPITAEKILMGLAGERKDSVRTRAATAQRRHPSTSEAAE